MMPRVLRALIVVVLAAVVALTGAPLASADPDTPPTPTPDADTRAATAVPPGWNDAESTIEIPDVPGVQYAIDGTDVAPGTHTVEFPQENRSVTVTVTATNEDGRDWTWRHTFPFVLEPPAPQFKDRDLKVFAPGVWGMHYAVVSGDVDRKLNPASWNDVSDLVGKPLTIEARPNGNSLLLVGQTTWEHTFAAVPDYDISGGDEFNENGLAKSWYVSDGHLRGKGRHSAENVSVITTPEGDGVLNLRSRRHCVKDIEDPLTDANATEEVCPDGTQTMYSSSNIMSRYVHGTPKSIEVRAKMDVPHEGVTLAAWAHNEQKFCRDEYPDTDIAEMDVLEVWGTKQSIATTHMDCGPDGFPRYSVGVDKDLPGDWHTWRVEYDGYAIRYFLDGQRLDGDKGPHVTPETMGLTQQKFSQVMNDYNWQTIIGAKFPPNGSWAPFVDDNKPFHEHNDQIDYIRVETFDLGECAPYGEIGAFAERHPELGAPQSCESDAFTPGSRVQVFENGRVYWSLKTGAHAVVGRIMDRYIEMGGDRVLGLPIADELTGLRDGGASQRFTQGTMFWSLATDAHFMKGEILKKYAAMGWENHALGYPITDENCGIVGGCFQRFQHANGHIYWSPSTGAHFTRGLIHARYGAMGWERGDFGYPVTDEICGLRDGGCFQRFQRENGHVYWSPRTGAWGVQGRIFDHWATNRWETGRYGYPTGAESCRSVGAQRECVQSFQKGRITWNSGRGTW